MRLTGLSPICSKNTVILILGSFPGEASLRAQQYYGHPQNHFWRILSAIWPQHPMPAGPDSYPARCAWLLERGLGLWDVYASCERQGSLDAAIRHAQVNDFARLRHQCPRLAAIAHNGTESFKHAQHVRENLAMAANPAAIESIKLPSTSPANASWSFERKLAAWAELMVRHGLA